MSRLTFGLALASLLAASAASAQTQAEIAQRENEQGKTLMFDGKYAEASAKFQDAVARVPEPKYFFNLCTSRFQEGKFGEALTACNAADKNGDDKLKAKSAKLVERIREEAKKQGIDLQATGGGGGPGETPPVGADPNQPPVTDPNNPNATPPAPGTGAPPAVGRPPSVGLFQSTAPENKYTWSLGVDFYAGGGQIGQPDAFGTAATGLRLKGDYMLNAAARFGTQVYLQITHFGQGEDMLLSSAQTLDVFDLGVAAYKHLCGPHARGCLTALAGIQLAMMSPADENDGAGTQVFNYAAAGARLEIGYQYALGGRFEHVLGIHLGTNLYTAAFGEPMDGFSLTAEQRGLDKGGGAGYLALGYTYRFQTPLGSSPFVTLE